MIPNTLSDEDFDIRDDPNTDIYMYTPDKALAIANDIMGRPL
jgi:hypothetical protein